MSLRIFLKSLLVSCLLTSSLVHATGVKPQTSVVIVNEADGEGTMTVKNTDASPVLLYSKLENIPEDKEPLLVVTPPVARVEGGASQLVRFVLNEHAPLKTERLKRVAFEGIPTATNATDHPKVSVIIRQDLPVIIHPRGLAPNDRPWQLLKWSVQGSQLMVRNDSPYIVRLDQRVELMPQKIWTKLPKPYLLPGDAITLSVTGLPTLNNSVRIFPATVYGYSVDSYDAPLGDASKVSAKQ
jgi:P pilus assembly chaperone PapD